MFGKKYTNVYLRPREFFPSPFLFVFESPHDFVIQKVGFTLIFCGSWTTVLSKLLLAFKDVDFPRRPNPKFPPEPQPLDMTTATPEIIKQNYVWKRLGRFSRPGDILVVDCGTAQFGMSEATFSSGSTYVTQLYFGSIGYSVPSCLGVGLAQREMTKRAEAEANDGNASPPSPSSGGRLILIVGDGSLQLTVQEMGSIIKHGLNPIMYEHPNPIRNLTLTHT